MKLKNGVFVFISFVFIFTFTFANVIWDLNSNPVSPIMTLTCNPAGCSATDDFVLLAPCVSTTATINYAATDINHETETLTVDIGMGYSKICLDGGQLCQTSPSTNCVTDDPVGALSGTVNVNAIISVGVNVCSPNLIVSVVLTCLMIGGGGGDPHFKTLDGLKYNYDGPCSYILLTDRCEPQNDHNNHESSLLSLPVSSVPSFEVITTHTKAKSRFDNVYVIQQLSIRIFNKSYSKKIQNIELRSRRVLINDETAKLPYSNDLFDIKENTKKEILFDSVNGLHILWSSDRSGDLKLMAEGKTCGLLGSNDPDNKYNLKMRNGKVIKVSKSNGDEWKSEHEDLINEFGDSWMIHEENEELRCKLYPENSAASFHECFFELKSVQETCEQMIQRQTKKITGAGVEKCFGKKGEKNGIDLSRIYDDCVTEICACKSEGKCSPLVAIKEFEEECLKNGLTKKEFPSIIWKS